MKRQQEFGNETFQIYSNYLKKINLRYKFHVIICNHFKQTTVECWQVHKLKSTPRFETSMSPKTFSETPLPSMPLLDTIYVFLTLCRKAACSIHFLKVESGQMSFFLSGIFDLFVNSSPSVRKTRCLSLLWLKVRKSASNLITGAERRNAMFEKVAKIAGNERNRK